MRINTAQDIVADICFYTDEKNGYFLIIISRN